MLRVTIQHDQDSLTFRLEGRLAGVWVREVEQCWRSTLDHQRKSVLRVDLTGVTFIDAPGKTCLAAMHQQGAELIATDCLTKEVVAQITQASFPEEGECMST